MSAALNGIIGHSTVMQELTTLVLKVASHNCSVLIRGESGTGKELVARSIQKNSKRAKGPFVPLNCGAMPDALPNPYFSVTRKVHMQSQDARDYSVIRDRIALDFYRAAGVREKAVAPTLGREQIAELSKYADTLPFFSTDRKEFREAARMAEERLFRIEISEAARKEADCSRIVGAANGNLSGDALDLLSRQPEWFPT
jgi:sigma-54 interacting transcriptional regulator